MARRDETALPLELWPTGSPAREVTTFAARAGDRLLADVVLVNDPVGLRASVVTREATVANSAELAALIAAIMARGRADGSPTIALATGSDLRLRYFARISGFHGPLRSQLVVDLRAPLIRPDPSGTNDVDRLLADLRILLPHVDLATTRQAGMLRSFLRSAASGVSGTVHLTAGEPPGPRPLQVAVPAAADVMAEGVALAIDTAVSLRRRFQPLLDRVRVFFDEGVHGMRAGTLAGLAEPSVRDVHLNRAYASVSGTEWLQRQRQERLAAEPDPSRRAALTVPPPFTWVDALVAHEFWHQIEFGLESGRYNDSVEFRRVVGGYFGVDTLEHAIKGGRGDAPIEWQAARSRLAAEVSEYAATAPKEATAELFSQWWCTRGEPPPSAQFFGDVLRQFFPAADLVR